MYAKRIAGAVNVDRPGNPQDVTSSFDPKKGTVQAATGSINGIPTFPHTKVPIMPPDLWWQGRSSKEGLHEHEGHDPVIVARVPKLLRYQPPPTVQCLIGTRWLRSTWFLCGGSWEKAEDRVEPALQWERIDKHVERAVWQFHPIQPAAPARQVIQPRQHFGQDESFQLLRRTHAHHREQDNHPFFVPYRIAVRNHLRPADPKANITFRFVSHNGTVLGLPGYAYVSESHNWFTALALRWHVQVVTITLQDDLLSQYGENLAKQAITKSSDMLFFAGPCTGGSSWARLNITRGPTTSKLIHDKQLEFWKCFPN